MKPDSGVPLWPLIALALPLLMVACTTPPKAAPIAQAVAEPAPMIVQPLPQAPSIIDELLSYQQSLLQMKREDLQKETASNLDAAAFTSARAMLQKAMALAALRGPGDLLRAQQLAEQVLRSNDSQARAARPLAQLLASSYADLRRQTEQSERLAQQTREQQRRIDQLDHMLEGLKAIERNLATRPGASVPAGAAKP